MRGYPKSLNTKEDYMFVIDNFPREKWINDIKGLVETSYDWFYEKNLKEDESGLEDDTHKIVVTESDGKETRAQYVLKVNPLCKMYRIGFTENEIEKIILAE